MWTVIKLCNFSSSDNLKKFVKRKPMQKLKHYWIAQMGIYKLRIFFIYLTNKENN